MDGAAADADAEEVGALPSLSQLLASHGLLKLLPQVCVCVSVCCTWLCACGCMSQ